MKKQKITSSVFFPTMTREEFLEKTNYREENIKGCFNCAYARSYVYRKGFCARFDMIVIKHNGVCGYWIGMD